MLTVLIVLAATCILGFGLAFYLGWFNLSPDDRKTKSRIASWVDTRKLKAQKAAKAKGTKGAKQS